MKLADEIGRDVLNIAVEIALFAEKEGKSRNEAINTAVSHVRAHSNLSMIEQMRVRSWLENELEEKAQLPKGDSKPAKPKPPLFQRVVGPDGTAVIQELSGYVARAKALLNRKTVLAVGAFLVAVAGLFPPWVRTATFSGGIHSENDAGYALILSPPAPEDKSEPYGIRLNIARLVVEWLCIAAATGAAWLIIVPFGARKTIGLIILGGAMFTVSPSFCLAQPPPVQWAESVVSTNSLIGNGIALDGLGNIYVTGGFNGSLNFGLVTLNAGAGIDMFLAKYAPSGEPLWAIAGGGTNTNSNAGAGPSKSIATDGAGNAYIACSFQYSATFGNLTISNNTGNPYGVVAKVDEAGNYLWVQPLEAAVDLIVNGVAADTNGNCFVTGSFSGQATIGGIQLNNTSCPTCNTSGFIAKYNTSGNILWATESGFATGGICPDGSGNVFVTGNVLSTANVWGNTQTNLSSQPSSDVFVAKYDSAGNFIWVSGYGNTSLYPNGGDYGNAVAIGSDGSIYMAGTELGNNTDKTFVFKYSTSGSLVWSAFGTGGYDSGPVMYAISVDSSNFVYMTGYYTGTASFGGTNLASSGLFVGKYNGAGNLQWVSGFGQAGTVGSGIAVTSRGDNIYLTGYFASKATFGNFTLTTATNKQDFFLANLSTDTNLPSGWLLVDVDGQAVLGTNIFNRGSATIALLSSFTNAIIGYSLDGSDPRISSTLYTGPFTVNEPALLQAVAYNSTLTASVEADALQITILPALTANTAGGGSVSINPPSGAYLSNSIAQITAQPASGWTFLQWLGDASGTNPATAVTMSGNRYVEAVFGTAVRNIVIGGGSVLADPTLPLYPFGTTIKFTAEPQAGNFLSQWGASASGTINPLNFLITNATPTIAAVFSPLGSGQYALTVIENGQGHVTPSPRATNYSNGQTVTLTATPEPGQNFLGWSGDATGTQNPMVVTMNQSHVITANFTTLPTLRVGTPLEGLVEDGFRLTLLGEFGGQYEIFVSTNLMDWLPAGLVTNTFGTTQFTDPAGTNLPYRFYRAEAQ